jgi:hypothetical protein
MQSKTSKSNCIAFGNNKGFQILIYYRHLMLIDLTHNANKQDSGILAAGPRQLNNGIKGIGAFNM